MKLSQRIVQHLEQFTAQGPQAVDAAIIRDGKAYIIGLPAEGDGPSVALTIADYDRYSVTLLNVEVNQATDEAQALEQYAEQVARRLTYLEEPLTLLELAEEDNLAQLRSQAPSEADEVITYWEALIWNKPQPRATLARYRWSPDQPDRQAIPYPATFTQVARMAEDLAASLEEVGEA